MRGADKIVTSAAIITMDDDAPRAEAVAVDTRSGMIVQVGTRSELVAAHPGAEAVDLGTAVVVPGFIDAHSHPLFSGMVCMPPTHWIAPYVGYGSYDEVAALFRTLDAQTPAGKALVFNGLDRILQSAPEIGRDELDLFFPSRPVLVLDNSGHEAYFNTAHITALGWDGAEPPVDPTGGRYGRRADGRSDGRAYEMPAVMAVALPMIAAAGLDPLAGAAKWYRLMAENGITATTDHTFTSALLPIVVALGAHHDTPLRLSLYHMSTDKRALHALPGLVHSDMVRKVGIKIWADGSPWVGNIASTYPYADTETVRAAGIPIGPSREAAMNYTPAELDALLERFAGTEWQFSIHVNGDYALDRVLDAYERALDARSLRGTDHLWRVEHVGGARADQFARAARLGIAVSMAPFQFLYWGDVLDGELFPHEIGSQWQRFSDAITAGASVSFHNDGSVSPPVPLRNIQAAVTRRTSSGQEHGPEQRMSVEDALRAHTRVAAAHIRRPDLGVIAAGRRADFTVLSADPTAVDPLRLTEDVTVVETWRDGRRIDLDAFDAQVARLDRRTHVLEEVAVALLGTMASHRSR